MPKPPPPTLDKGVVAVFEQMIEVHGQAFVLDMARGNNDVGKMARRFWKQARRMTFVFHKDTTYDGINVIAKPSYLTRKDPPMGAPYNRHNRSDVPLRPLPREDRLITDKYFGKGRNTVMMQGNGAKRPQADIPDDTPFVARPLKITPPAPKPTPKRATTPKAHVTLDGKDHKIDQALLDMFNGDPELVQHLKEQGITLPPMPTSIGKPIAASRAVKHSKRRQKVDEALLDLVRSDSTLAQNLKERGVTL